MIPAPLLPRLAACSTSELATLWRAFESLLDGIEKGRPQYGTEPGADGRDYVAEAMNELRDGLLYLAMAKGRMCACAECILENGEHARFCPARCAP